MGQNYAPDNLLAETMNDVRKFRIGLVQTAVSADPDRNQEEALRRIADAAARGANVICLPELYRSPYFCQQENVRFFDLAEPVPGPSSTAMSEAAKRLGVVIVVPIFERRAPGLYHNSAVVIDADGSTAGFYRKMHIPDDPAYYEKYYFTPGDLGFKAFDTRFGRIATLICWDQWYPEGARIAALHGASVLFYPTAIGWHPAEKSRYGKAQRESWQTIQRAHAIANGVYVGSVNRIGLERPDEHSAGIEFWGSSFVSDPQGVVIAEAPADREETLIAEVDLDHLENIRRNWPFLRDRRIDAYTGVTSRFLDGEVHREQR